MVVEQSIFVRISERTAANGRFGASGTVARTKVCADLEVYRPSEQQWKPRLRQAAGMLKDYENEK